MKTAILWNLIIIMFLFFSYVTSVSVVPSKRSLEQSVEDKSSIPQSQSQTYLLHQETVVVDVLTETPLRETMILLERRMDMETNDYPDPGANRGHDPPVDGTP